MDIYQVMQALRTETGRGDPYPLYPHLHRLGAACRIPDDAGERYRVVVHGYDAVNQVLRDPAFRAVDGELLERSGRNWRQHPSLSALLTSMFFTNGDRHTRMRAAFSRAFIPRRMESMREPIARLTIELLDEMATKSANGGPVDFMQQFGFPLPGEVICEVMGVPRADRAWFLDRAHIFGDLLDLGFSTDEVYQRADTATVELTEYFADLAAQRRKDPGPDMISAVARTDDSAHWVDDTELFANLLTIFNAGYATTSHLLGKSVPLLAGRPERLAELCTGDEIAGKYVDEILRIDPPTHFVVRHSPDPQEIAGVRVPPDSLLLVLIGAANHDPARFTEPATFDPHRSDNRPLAFGAGIHFCLGTPLARLEGIVALPLLYRRFPGLQLAGEGDLTRRLTLHGYRHLPVTLH